MDLAADGQLRLRCTGALELDAAGSWAFDHFSLYIRLERVSKGVDVMNGKVGCWEMEKSSGNEMLLKEGNETLRMVRR
jgi:hypothetical protein